jgi:hypothetical protein
MVLLVLIENMEKDSFWSDIRVSTRNKRLNKPMVRNSTGTLILDFMFPELNSRLISHQTIINPMVETSNCHIIPFYGVPDRTTSGGFP